MKKFTLLMVAGLFALAGSIQAQEMKKSLIAEDITIKAGETAELVINIDYEAPGVVAGTNFSVSFPDGLILDGFNSKDEMLAAKTKALKKACSIDEENNPWGENGDDSFIYDLKGKADGGLLFILIDSDQTPFVSTHCKLITLKVKALQDIEGTGKIYGIGFTSPSSESLDLGKLEDYEFGVNTTQGINDIKAADATAPAYNLQGVRVNNAAKGVIIRDGKKMVVK